MEYSDYTYVGKILAGVEDGGEFFPPVSLLLTLLTSSEIMGDEEMYIQLNMYRKCSKCVHILRLYAKQSLTL
jgi:hypothetical protein